MKTVEARQQYITADGVLELKQRLADLRCARAKIMGELHDFASQSTVNSALEDLGGVLHKCQASEIDNQIMFIEHTLSTATVVPKPASNRQVQIGSQVTVDMGGVRQTYSIVGSVEADPDKGKVSNESPLGLSLLGKKVNDQLEVARLYGRLKGTIIAIE